MKTRGVHSDQLAAAIQATEHALNMIALTPAPSGAECATRPSPLTPIQKEEPWPNSAQKNR